MSESVSDKVTLLSCSGQLKNNATIKFRTICVKLKGGSCTDGDGVIVKVDSAQFSLFSN